jgi:hypothetical protein
MTHYQLLGVPPTTTTDQIRSAYRKKAFQLHPDRNKSSNAHQQFIAVRLAYEVLSDPKKRAKYDAKLSINEFPPITDQQSSQPSYEDAHLRDIYEEIEYFKHIHYDPIEEWVKLYRMSWREWSSIPIVLKFKKIAAEFVFRSFYAILGIFIYIFFSIYFLRLINSYHFNYPFFQGLIYAGLFSFVFAKGIRKIYSNYKKED